MNVREIAAELTRREVAPHLQEWEDAQTVPRELHVAAAKQGLLGVSFPESVGGQGGDLLDSVELQEGMFEAGASSGLMAALFTGGIALPHIAANGSADLVDRFGVTVMPTLVATSAAPVKTTTAVFSPAPSPMPAPPTNGKTTPNTPTSAAARPTSRRSPIRVSSPTQKRRKTAPSSEKTSVVRQGPPPAGLVPAGANQFGRSQPDFSPKAAPSSWRS